MIRLELRRHGKSLQHFEFGQEVVFIGRDPKNDISFDDRSASRHHARIVASPTGYELEDLGSRNGTKLNDAPATRVSLQLNDVIQIGGHALVVLHAGPGAPPPIDPEPPLDELDRTRAALYSDPEPDGPAWNLIVERDGTSLLTAELAETTTIGRDPTCNVVLPDDDVSRQHARILRKHGKYYIEDRDSLNGTLVDGEPVYTSKLGTETDLRIGPYRLRLVQPEATASSSEPAVCRECRRTVNPTWPSCPFCLAAAPEPTELHVPLEPLKAPDAAVAGLTRRVPLRLAEETIASERHFWVSFDESERIRHPVGQVPDSGQGCPRCLFVSDAVRSFRVCPVCCASRMERLDLRSILRDWTSRGSVEVLLRGVVPRAEASALVSVTLKGHGSFGATPQPRALGRASTAR